MPDTNERRTDSGYSFFFHTSIVLSPTRYDSNYTTQMIKITYREKGGSIRETWYAVIMI